MERLTESGSYCSVVECDYEHKCGIKPNCYDKRLYDKLKEYEDLEEQGLLLKKEDAVDEGYLYDWYIHSVSGEEPVWTEVHLAELFNDFILIPRAEVEKGE